MSAVHEEYGRFLQWLRDAQVSEDARRIAKIVHANLDTLIPTVNNGGQRATTLTPILRRDIRGTTDLIEAIPANGAAPPLPWTRLKKLSVGPFRGFRWEEQFDLSKDIVLFLGPNGSGKSSLCEAIEFALLGYVEEATAKRIEDLAGYFNNFHAGEHVAPRLWSAGADDGVLVDPNPELLRFTIIERNRIEGFARLASRPPAQAGLLIAALFGLDSFNSFVGNFTGDLDSKLRLATPKAGELALKNAALDTARQKVAGHGAAVQSFNEEQEALAQGFEAGLTFAGLLEKLGLHGREGRLQQLHAELQEQLPALSAADARGVATLRKSLRLHLKNLAESEANLAGRAEQVSFLELYRAVHALQGEHITCPACETSLDNVARNPFEKAAAGIELLRDLAQLQREQRKLAESCTTVSKWLRDQLKTAHRFSPFKGNDLRTWCIGLSKRKRFLSGPPH
ncbi:AAA family ATPase [Xanthomonas euvesicatoria]|uniref:AAA family ATPase n=1 Tax=Xanthomonas euvesicatoria TaxID=456327 RepID=UPI001C4922D5|nr:ATP-binding protein [Xanthomonas euvesicatoria]MBV6829947.1 AAA family ATPase [Xanthomonas campestris pv. viegasii]